MLARLRDILPWVSKILFEKQEELGQLTKFLREQEEYFETRTAAAVRVSVADPSQLPEDVNLHKVAAWATVSRALLNLDETLTRE